MMMNSLPDLALMPEPDGPHRSAFLRIVAILRAGMMRMCLAGLALAALVATLTVLTPRTWTSRSAMTPQQRRTAGNSSLTGLAAQLGVGVPLGDGAQSVFFYAELIRSRELLREIVGARYRTQTGDSTTVAALIGVRDADSLIRLDNTIRRLSQRLTVSADPKTNIVRFSVSVRDAISAQQIATAGTIRAGVRGAACCGDKA
jgi:hypothetical protein